MRTALFSFIILVWISAWASPSDAAPRQGRLSIDSFTPGAQIFVDGKLRGVTPLKTPLKLMVGRRTVRVSKLGYGDFIDTVRIYRGRQQSLTVDLIPVAGVLRVESDPGGADVILNGRILGTTPFKGAVEPGQHSLELNLPNHLMHRRSIFIQVGEEAFVRQTLLYRPGGVVDNERPWYRNHWIWVGAAGLVLVSAVITAVALSADDDPNTNDVNPLTIETVR